MGGWFTREISSPEGFQGLRYRMPGPGAEVLRRLGATVVLLPVGEIGPALRSGALDASEFVGPWTDMAVGLHKAARYYYYPGFHEPASAHTLGVNRRVWDGLDGSDRGLIEAAAAAEYMRGLADYDTNNAQALRQLRDERSVDIRRFDGSVLKVLKRLSADVVAEIGSIDDLSRRIHASHQQFRTLTVAWNEVADRAFLDARATA
jgi:TRAP-type mannitol/chloroaromatic compound transport system substrate-binding protein